MNRIYKISTMTIICLSFSILFNSSINSNTIQESRLDGVNFKMSLNRELLIEEESKNVEKAEVSKEIVKIESEMAVKSVKKEVKKEKSKKVVAISRGDRRESLGVFGISAYCSCNFCCGKTDGITYSGTHVKEGRTIAVDPHVIPIGTEVYIEGVGYRIAEDIGGAIKRNRIDLYFNSHQDALDFGRRKLEVHIVNR